MELDKLLVTVSGGILIILIYWFFFGKRESTSKSDIAKVDSKGNKSLYIIVDGGYKPAVIFLEKDKKIRLKIIRKDPNTCLSDIIIPDLKISKYLPLNKEVYVDIDPQKEGEFTFHCGMNMFHGKLVVS